MTFHTVGSFRRFKYTYVILFSFFVFMEQQHQQQKTKPTTTVTKNLLISIIGMFEMKSIDPYVLLVPTIISITCVVYVNCLKNIH